MEGDAAAAADAPNPRAGADPGVPKAGAGDAPNAGPGEGAANPNPGEAPKAGAEDPNKPGVVNPDDPWNCKAHRIGTDLHRERDLRSSPRMPP